MDQNGVEKNVITIPPTTYNLDPRGIGCMYYDYMLKNPDKIALIDGLCGSTVTYKDLLLQAIRTSIALEKDGVRAGDVVAVYSYNHLDLSSIAVGALFRAATVVGIVYNSPIEWVTTVLKQTTPKLIFAVEETVSTLSMALKQLSVKCKIVLLDGVSETYTPLSNYLQAATVDEENAFKPVQVDSLNSSAAIVFTSGTTNVPKGVCRSHLNILCSTHYLMNSNHSWDVILNLTTPIGSVYLYVLTIAVLQGTSRLIYGKFSSEYSKQLSRHKVTCVIGSTFDVLAMAEHGPIDFGCLKTLMAAGEPLSSNKMNKIKSAFSGVEISNMYGNAELGFVLLRSPLTNSTQIEEKPFLVGKGLPGMSYKVIDLGGHQILGPNQNGELRVKTIYDFGHYLKSDVSFAYDEDGWYKTGDLVYYDDDANFYLIDRIQNIFKCQQHIVLPSLIEDVLYKHPAVERAMVTGVLHERDGERLTAVVELKKGFKDTTSDELQQFVDQQVLSYQRLTGGVKIIEKLQATASRKLDRDFIKSCIDKGTI